MGESPAHSRTRVLIIDDDPMVGRTIARVLRARYDVVVLTCAEQAVARLAVGETFDVIICDYALPGMNGPAFRSCIKQVSPDHFERIFFASGAALEDRDATVQCLEKPFTQAALLEAIEQCLARCGPLLKAVAV